MIGTKAKITFDAQMIRRIKHSFSKAGFYDIEYFERVAQKYNSTVEEILYELAPNNEFIRNNLLERLHVKGRLFIGNKRINDEFLERNMETLHKLTIKYSKIIGRRLGTVRDAEDIASDTIFYVITKKGDIVENSLTEEEAINRLKGYIWKMLEMKHLEYVRPRTISLDAKYREDDKRTLGDKIASTKHTAEDLITEIDQERIFTQYPNLTPIKAIEMCLNSGMGSTEAMEKVMEKFRLSREELLKLLKEELEIRERDKSFHEGQGY